VFDRSQPPRLVETSEVPCQTQRSATGASRPGRRHRHSACRRATVRWTVMVRPRWIVD
jgi:hypothetical protein